MPDMLILAAPVVIVLLWCLVLILLICRKWKASLVVFCISCILNIWLEQIPLNPFSCIAKVVLSERSFDAPPSVKQPDAVRVLAYNICAKAEFTTIHDEEFIAYIKGLDADILILPEDNPGSSNQFDDAMKEYYPYNAQQLETGNEHVGERTFHSRYPLQNLKIYHIDPEQLVREHPEIDSTHVRALGKQLTIFEVEADIRGQLVTFLHLHLRSNQFDINNIEGEGRKQKVHSVYDNLNFGYVYRDMEARIIRDSLKNCPNPLIICGDFNDLSGSVAMSRIQSCREYNIHSRHRDRLKNAWWKGGTGLGFTFADQHLRLRLDHILYSKEFDLINVVVPKVHYSDHRPIIADFKFNP